LRWALAVLLIAGCTSTQNRSGLSEGADLHLEVDCEQGSKVIFRGNRAQDKTGSGTSVEVDGSAIKGVVK